METATQSLAGISKPVKTKTITIVEVENGYQVMVGGFTGRIFVFISIDDAFSFAKERLENND